MSYAADEASRNIICIIPNKHLQKVMQTNSEKWLQFNYVTVTSTTCLGILQDYARDEILLSTNCQFEAVSKLQLSDLGKGGGGGGGGTIGQNITEGGTIGQNIIWEEGR